MKRYHAAARSFWHNRARHPAADFAPPLALFFAGIPIALDYGRTGRIDLLLGGVLVSMMGVALADHVAGRHLFSRLAERLLPFVRTVPDKLPLALIGLATTFTLFVGETLCFLTRHPAVFSQEITPYLLRDMTMDPSFLKILATGFFFPAASLMNLPRLHARLEKELSGLEIKCIQNLCGLGGASLIGMFGLMIGAVSALSFGILCGFAHLASFSIRSSHLECSAPSSP